jgi:hypothetical protein
VQGFFHLEHYGAASLTTTSFRKSQETMATLPLNLDECTVKITQEAHYEPEYANRMSSLDVVARHPQLGELAKMRCTIVGRRSLFKTHGDFLRMMDEESDELMQFSKKLFDAHSNVQPWLIDGRYKSGSGCWGKELNKGQIVHFEDLIVKEQVSLFIYWLLLLSDRVILDSN